MTALLASVLSIAVILLLCRNDPKRRRAARQPGEGYRSATRRWMAMLACLPGIACLAAGNAAGFLVWLGLCGVAGWIISLWFARETAPRAAADNG